MADFNSLKNKILAGLGTAADMAKTAGEQTKDFAEKAADKTRDLAEKAADKAKSGARIAKLNVEIAGEKENMKKTYLEIGKLYYDTHKDAPEGFFIQLCEEIALAEKNIADKLSEIEALKAEDDGSIEVEFEEIVDGEEECSCGCSCMDKVKETFEATADEVEEIIEAAEEKAEELIENLEEKLDD